MFNKDTDHTVRMHKLISAVNVHLQMNGLRREKTCLWVLRREPAQVQMLARKLKIRLYNTFQFANNKGADQPARMCGSASVLFASPPKQGFSRPGPNENSFPLILRGLYDVTSVIHECVSIAA